jgi:2-keto-4-pentenoate hydratase/2-oxohepta-3-ene-1,7-dioic acid hydratase in catechol pathway
VRFGTVDRRLIVVRDDRYLDVESATSGRLPSDPVAALERWNELTAWADGADWSSATTLEPTRLGAPVPTPRQVFAVALNYAPHAAEAGFEPPVEPLIFTKFPSCITGPVTDVVLPEGDVDWEIEVVAVVGRGGFRIPRADAWDALAGVTIGQDLSERVGQLAGKPPQFSLGKSHPGFGPTGPLVVGIDELADRDDLAFESFIGEERIQHGRTSRMVFPIDDLVHRISQICPLLPGDLIFTGTPEGVGNRRSPQRFLKAGETLVSRLDGVGEIRQTFTNRRAHP